MIVSLSLSKSVINCAKNIEEYFLKKDNFLKEKEFQLFWNRWNNVSLCISFIFFIENGNVAKFHANLRISFTSLRLISR